MRDRLRQTAVLALASLGALSVGAGHALAANDVFTLTGALADFQSQTTTTSTGQYIDNYLQLSGVSSTTVSQGDTVTVNVSLDQPYTMPASQTLTSVLLFLQGDGFDGSSVGTTGSLTFYS